MDIIYNIIIHSFMIIYYCNIYDIIIYSCIDNGDDDDCPAIFSGGAPNGLFGPIKFRGDFVAAADGLPLGCLPAPKLAIGSPADGDALPLPASGVGVMPFSDPNICVGCVEAVGGG